MLLAHELQHNETMLQLLQLVDGYELPAEVEAERDSVVPLSAISGQRNHGVGR